MRTAYIDIETAPTLGYVWRLWETDVLSVEKNWYIICFTVKWENGKTLTYALPDFKRYKKNKEDDCELVRALWEVVNNADLIIAHNGDEFDLKKANARFIYHRLSPPPPYKTVDTLKVARKYFQFDSNKLDELGSYLRLGKKVHTGGFKLWRDCISGDMKSWAKMKKYNRQDVILLEKVYKKMRGWIQNHPNYNIFSDTEYSCPICGSTSVVKRGFSFNRASRYQRWKCLKCGGWSQNSLLKKNTLR
jgi:predicted RNA-binding Zn-ribbon protein involved in translation (DUF1610 family)